MKKKWGQSFCAAMALTLLLCGCAGSPLNGKSDDGNDSSENSTPAQTETEKTEDANTDESGENDTSEKEATEKEADGDDGNEDNENEETALSDEEALEYELYNLYIDINNEMVGWLDEVISSYFEAVVYQQEFELYEEDTDYYWCLSNASSFYDNMESAKALVEGKSGKDALDKAYIKLYPVMKELAQTLDQVAEYTDLKSYVDDDFAKGKEYHATIWEKYELYVALAETFIDELTTVANARSLEELEMLKEQGYEATYALIKMITTAQEIQAAIYEQGIDDSQVLELDIESLQPLYDQYVEEVQIILDFMKDENIMYEEGFPVKSASYSLLESDIQDSKVALTDLFERVRNQEALDEFELNSGIAADGTIAQFNESLSNMIDNYNNTLNY